MFTLTAKESILRAARKSDEMLEPYEWKRSRTVLRRERASNRPDLADHRIGHLKIQHMTYWAEYEVLPDGGYKLWNGYSHRMNLEGE